SNTLPSRPHQCELDNAVCDALDLRDRILRYSPLGRSQDKETASLLHLRPDSLQKVDSLLSFDPVKDRRTRVENQSHSSILSLRYERSDLNVEIGRASCRERV